MSETSCNRQGRKGQPSPRPQQGGRRGLRELWPVEVAGGDRMVTVLVNDGDLMVMLLVADGDSMLMVLGGHADRMVMVLGEMVIGW